MEINGAFSVLSDLGEANSDRAGIADNFDTFLQILTTQLQNQNPLEPLDVNQFTQQLVQFSGVEQSIKTNQNLENLIKFNAASIATSAVNYIGKSVNAEGNTTALAGGNATWTYNAEDAAPDTTVTIRNSSGTIVYGEQLSVSAGGGTFNWNGSTNDGDTAPDGNYTISFDAKDADGIAVPVAVQVSGKVDSVDLSGSEPQLMVGGKKIPLSDVTFVGA